MNKVYLSLGYDTERPFGQFVKEHPVEASVARKKQLAFVRKLLDTLDSEQAPRTMFILGDYLNGCANEYSVEFLRGIYDKKNPLTDIQQHTYSHITLKEIPDRKDRTPATAQEAYEDIMKAGALIKDVLGVNPTGLRTPLGYPNDLSDSPELLNALSRAGIDFVSSDLRSEGGLTLGELTPKRQPHTYENNGHPEIVELPSHGWQDSSFTASIHKITPAQQKIFGDNPPSKRYIANHYTDLLAKATDASDNTNIPVAVSLCLHPWAVMEYDPDLEILLEVVNAAKAMDIEIVSYKTLAELARK